MSGKKRLEFTARSIRNIADVEAYIAQDNPSAAQKVVKAFTTRRKAWRPSRKPEDRGVFREQENWRYPNIPTPSFTASELRAW